MIIIRSLIFQILCTSLAVSAGIFWHPGSTAAAAAHATTPPQLPNSGFESFMEEFTIPGWAQVFGAGEEDVYYEVSNEDPYEGGASLLLDDNNPYAGLGFESASFPVSPGMFYIASAMMKVERGSVGMYTQFYNEDGIKVAEKGIWTATASGNWAQGEMSSIVPADAATAKILVYSSVSGRARGYIDSIHVELMPWIENAGFEQVQEGAIIPGWSQVFGAGEKDVHYEVSSSSYHEGTKSLLLDDNNASVGLGFESAAIKVVPSVNYSLSVMTKVDRGALGIYARYYNSSGVKIGEAGKFTANDAWENHSIDFTPPVNTETVKILIYSSSSGRARGFADAVQIIQTTPSITNEGFESDSVRLIPSDWTQTYGAGEQNVAFELSQMNPYEGARSLLLDDNSATSLLGLESAHFPVEPGVSYSVSAMQNVERGSLALYARFFDETGVMIAESGNWTAPTDGKWVKSAVSAVVPAGAATASILIYSSSTGRAKGYSDAVRVELIPIGTFENIGAVVEGMINEDAAIGVEDGSAVVYTLFKGRGEVPATFAVIDALTREVLRSFPLPGVEAAWGIKIATDGRVYIGTHYDGGLYRYTPGTNDFEYLGRFGNETHVFSMAAGADGKMYAGTYPGGRLFEYDPVGGEIRDLGQPDPEQRYVRSLAYDAKRDVLYVGAGGTKSRVFKRSPDGSMKELLAGSIPGGGDTYTWPYGISFAADRLFVKFSNGDLLILRAEDDVVEYYDPQGMDIHSERAIEIPDQQSRALFSYNTDYYVYDSETVSFEKVTGVEGGTNFWDGKFIELGSPDWPGLTFVAAGRHGNIEYYNAATGIAHAKPASYSAPTLIQSIHNGPDGNIYVAGYMSGFTAYNPIIGSLSDTNTLGQVESSAIRDGHMLLGAYAGSRILDFDPTQPWSESNPTQLFDLRPYAQDRPFAMQYAEDRDQLFVGNVPVPSSLQGALAVYDFQSNELEVIENLIPNQSIVSLLYKDGLLYGGTTVFGGLGTIGPAAQEGRLFIYDPETRQIVFQTVPVQGRKGVTGLNIGPDGLIWGVAEDHNFKFDSASRKIVSSIAKLRRYKEGGTVWTYGFLQPGLDGNMYGTSRGQFFMVKPETMEFMLLNGNYGNYLQRDDYGSFYFSDNSSDLWKYTPPYEESLMELLNALKSARNKLQATPTGEQIGQVPYGQRQALQHAWDAANNVKSTLYDDTQAIRSATAALKAAMVQFDLAIVALRDVALHADQTEMVRGESVTLAVYGTTSLGTPADIKFSEIQYKTSDPMVADISMNGTVTARAVGTAVVWGEAMWQDVKYTTAPLQIHVVVNAESIRAWIDAYEDNGQLEHALAQQLRANAEQASHHKKAGNVEQSIKHLDDFVRHLNNRAKNVVIEELAKATLAADAEALKTIWSE
ncbi:Ig-like domain-containing protein [Paenibacillus sp.]|uniref:FIMAH domain-containing protein n=1 Tax=Paenibacillus sp. TaxID=58172 RepID=UPI002810BFA9|nr:Ig-like domain-containing protein [Paenibacillus sp.]